MNIEKSDFGKTTNGHLVNKYTLDNGLGVTVEVLNFGYVIWAFNVPDKNGRRSMSRQTLKPLPITKDSVRFLESSLGGMAIALQRPHSGCYAVRSQAILLDIELVFLPSYSPNLNLIERYWKFVKKKCLYNRFYEDFESFCTAIDECLANGNKVFAEELKTLMNLKFQSFENVQFLAV